MSYNYNDGKSRIVNILKNKEQIKRRKGIPDKNSSFNYDNGIYAWTTSIFIDVRDSSRLINQNDNIDISKILRAFISETLEILNGQKSICRELEIRGDCVYGIYSTYQIEQMVKVFKLTWEINSMITMLNCSLKEYGLEEISVGIGIATAYEFICKVGRHGTGSTNKIWIGDAVHQASNLSNIMARNGRKVIGIFNTNIEKYLINPLVKEYPHLPIRNWFTKFRFKGKYYYECNIKDGPGLQWLEENC